MVIETFAGKMLGHLWLFGHLGHLWALHALSENDVYDPMKI